MVVHKIVMREPRRLVRKNDIEFTIRVDGELMGTLLVSRGSLDYRPANKQHTLQRRWREVHEFFTGEKWEKSGIADDFDESDID